MPAAPPSITIRTVAREAGVAVSTVSRTLNGGVVSEETEARVRAVMDRLGFVPSVAAQGLVRRRTDAVGVVLPYLAGEFYLEVIRGLEQVAQDAHRFVMLSSSHNTLEDSARVLGLMRGRVDGMVVMTPGVTPAQVAKALPPGLPTVLLNTDADGHPFDVVSTDGYAGARLAVEHLVALGHQRVAILAGEPANHDAELRLNGWRDVLAENGLPHPDAWVLRGDFSHASGFAAGQELARLLDGPDAPTAVFASSDFMALGAGRALSEAGRSVPDDVSIVGFDNLPIGHYAQPPLTTVDASSSALGEQAMRWILERIAEPEMPPRHALMPCRLVVRSSTAAPRAH